jgi:putative NIF3 family GTP cyclohydrolase 1 type 2
MDAKELYQKLDKDFELDKCRDEWQMDYNEFISDNFKKRQMGILLDNSKEINFVYTTVFPSDEVLNKILNSGKQDVLLFTHHPMIWDIRNAPRVFTNINRKLLPKLREKRISIYTLHVPLDKNGEYSTTMNLAKVLRIIPEDEFCEYYGVKVGIVGKTKLDTSEELANKIASIVKHKVKLWKYGTNEIKDHKVALVAGGGNEVEVFREIVERKINIFVTGVTALNNYSREAHEFAKENKINIIGATHYSTEKFACIAMCDYFKKRGLPCEFIEDKPILEDME